MSEVNIPLTVVDNNQVVGMEAGAGVIKAVSPTVDLERVTTPNPGVKVTVKDVRGEHSETVLDGSAGDPSALIDDTAAAAGKTYSSNKIEAELTPIKSDLTAISDETNTILNDGIGKELTPVSTYTNTRVRPTTQMTLQAFGSDCDTKVYAVQKYKSYIITSVCSNASNEYGQPSKQAYVFASQNVSVSTAGIVISWGLGKSSSNEMQDSVFTPLQDGYLYVVKELNSVMHVKEYNPIANSKMVHDDLFDGTYYNNIYVPNGGLMPTTQSNTRTAVIPVEQGKTYRIEVENNQWLSVCYTNIAPEDVTAYTESIKKVYYSESHDVDVLYTTNSTGYKYLYITLMRTASRYFIFRVYEEINAFEMLKAKAEASTVQTLSETVAGHTAAIEALQEGEVPISEEYIESAVADWLDDHPDATTTVQDGSVTEAKLNSAVFDKYGDVRHTKDVYDPDPSTYERRFGSNKHARDIIIYDSDNRVYVIGENTVVDRATLEVKGLWLGGGWLTDESSNNTVMNSRLTTNSDGMTARPNSSSAGENNTFFNNRVDSSSMDTNSGGIVVWGKNGKVIGNKITQSSKSGFSGITFAHQKHIALANFIEGFGAGLEVGGNSCIMSNNIQEGALYGVHHGGPVGSRNMFANLILLNNDIGFMNGGNQFTMLTNSIISCDTLQEDSQVTRKIGINGRNLNTSGLVMLITGCIIHNYDTPIEFENTFAHVVISDCIFVCDSQTTLKGFNNNNVRVRNCSFVNCEPANKNALTNLTGCEYVSTI